MSVIPQASIVGWGPQSAKEIAPTTFYKHPAVEADASGVDDVRVGPPEINGLPVPTLPHSVGPAVQGGFRIVPRLAGVLGWLLYGMAGNCTTTADSPEVGANTHVFKIDTTTNLPYLTIREHIKGNASDGSQDFGRDLQDCKVAAAQFSLSNDGVMPAVFGFVGRKYQHYDPAAISAWTWANADEADASVPFSSHSGAYLQIPGLAAGDIPVAGGTVTFANAANDIRRERVFGSPYIDDVTILSKSISFDMAVIYKDPQMYRAVMTGSATGTGWTSAPFTSSVDILMRTESNIGATATPYSLRIQVPKVMFTVNGGLQIAGNQSIMLRLRGTAVKPDAGDYATITLVNDYAGYVWPV